MLRTGALALSLLLVSCDRPITVETKASAAPPAQPGRYQIFLNPNFRADVYLVDTQEGRVWKEVQFNTLKGSPLAWEEQSIIDSQGKTAGGTTYRDLLETYGAAKRPGDKNAG